MKKKTGFQAGILAFLIVSFALTAAEEKISVSADDALSSLMRGNKRFVLMKTIKPRQTAERRTELAKGQSPFAVIIGCSDSRVPPEIVFDQGLGDIFIVRTAGNIVDDIAVGSVEYAVEHLGCRLIMVLGHKKCGAVDATIKQFKSGGEIEKETGSGKKDFIPSILAVIIPSVKKAKTLQGDLFENAIHINAYATAKALQQSKILTEYQKKDGLKIVCGYYDLDSGKVDVFLKNIEKDPYK